MWGGLILQAVNGTANQVDCRDKVGIKIVLPTMMAGWHLPGLGGGLASPPGLQSITVRLWPPASRDEPVTSIVLNDHA